jgi:GPN-loop GTPase
MIQLELPHVNVLSKIDLLDEDSMGQRLEFFTEVMDLSVLTKHGEESPFFARYAKLSEALASVVEDFGLVHFLPMNVMDDETVWTVAKTCDKALGYIHVEQKEEH